MDSNGLCCPVCLVGFDQNERIPRVIPCSHTICSRCLSEIIMNESAAQCPLDGVAIPRKEVVELYKVDRGMKQLLEDKQVWDVCSKHKEKLRLVCFDDKTQLCDVCLDDGAHQGHAVKTVRQIQCDVEFKRKELESGLQRLDKYTWQIGEALNETKTVFTDIIKNKFEEIRWMLSLKETELLTGVNIFFNEQKKQITDILGVDPGLRDSIIAKLSEYQKPPKFPEFYNLVEEDVSNLTSKLGGEAVNSFLKKINHNISDITSVFNLSLNSLTLYLSKINIPIKELSNTLGIFSEECGEVSPCKKNPCSLLFKAKTILRTKGSGDTLLITTDEKEAEDIVFNCTEWKNSKNVKMTITKFGLTTDDYNAFFHIWRNVDNISSFELICNNLGAIDKQLIELLPVIFWRTSEIKSLKLDFTKSRLGDEGINFFMKKILPKLNGLRSLDIRFWKTNLAGDSMVAFARSNLYIMRSLENFNLSLRDTRIVEDYAAQMFLPMPNVKTFCLNFMETNIADRTLEAFVKDCLSKMEKLESFKLYLGGTKVTDSSLISMFTAMPDVKEFLLDLGNTQVTDKAMQTFKKVYVPKMKSMENFELRLYSTNVTEEGAALSYVPMQNAKRVALHLGMMDIQDRSLDMISRVMVGHMPRLEVFDIKLFSTMVTDGGVLNLLDGLKHLKEFGIDLERTKVTNRLGNEFMHTVFPQMSALKKFDLRLGSTQVTEKVQTQINELKLRMSTKFQKENTL